MYKWDITKNELIRLWWPNFQGHSSRKTENMMGVICFLSENTVTSFLSPVNVFKRTPNYEICWLWVRLQHIAKKKKKNNNKKKKTKQQQQILDFISYVIS